MLIELLATVWPFTSRPLPFAFSCAFHKTLRGTYKGVLLFCESCERWCIQSKLHMAFAYLLRLHFDEDFNAMPGFTALHIIDVLFSHRRLGMNYDVLAEEVCIFKEKYHA